MGYRHTLGSKKILGIYFLLEKNFFCVLYFFEIFFEIFSWVSVGIEVVVVLF